jgi:endonuclease/exonuclease/phosphatase family metal-dependent hydrolase
MNSTCLQILQYNVYKSKDIVLVLLLEDPRIQQFDMILVQEPWYNPHVQASYNLARSNFYLLFQPHKETRVAVYISKSIPTTDWSIRYITPDLSALDITVQFTDLVRTLRIYNIYNPPPSSTLDNTGPSTLPDLARDLQEHPHEHTIVLGDINLHHPLWGGRTMLSQHIYADRFIDITEEHNLTQLTLPGAVTWSARGSESTIDLTYTTEFIASMVLKCIVRHDLDQHSDHYPIATTIQLQVAKQETTKQRV